MVYEFTRTQHTVSLDHKHDGLCFCILLPPSTDDIVQNIGSVGPNSEFSYSFTVVGLKIGTHNLVVGMESDKVELVTGEKEVCLFSEIN